VLQHAGVAIFKNLTFRSELNYLIINNIQGLRAFTPKTIGDVVKDCLVLKFLYRFLVNNSLQKCSRLPPPRQIREPQPPVLFRSLFIGETAPPYPGFPEI
jgi:hypothetical protein